MNLIGADDMQSAVMRRNGEVYEVLGELLGECSACDLHMAMSLISKLKAFGLHAPSDSIKIQPEAILERRQRRQRRCELLLHRTGFVSVESPINPQQSSQSDFGIWNDLPTDLLLQISEQLGDDDKQVVACVCSSWKQALGENTREISFTWAGRRTVNAMTEEALVNEVCNGAASVYTNIHIANFRRCELLQSKVLVKFVQNACHNLKEADLSGCIQLTDEGICTLVKTAQGLRKLHIASCSLLTNEAFKAIGANCLDLKELGACGCDKLSDEGLISLSLGTRKLKRINLGWCEALTSTGILALAENCPELKSVDLCGCLQVDDEGIAQLASKCPGLESLGLHCCRRLTDESCLALAKYLKNLSSLNISGCRVLSPAAVQLVLDSNLQLHTCGGFNRNVIVAGCLNLLAVSCACSAASQDPWPHMRFSAWT